MKKEGRRSLGGEYHDEKAVGKEVERTKAGRHLGPSSTPPVLSRNVER